MVSQLDDLLPALNAAQDAGLKLGDIKKKFVGDSKKNAKERAAALRDRLADLVRDGAVWGPLKHKTSQYYFAAGRGPSIETASAAVVRLVQQSGVKLLSRPDLEKKVTGMNRTFAIDGIKHAVASRSIVELACGKSKYYLHRDVAADYFDFANEPADAQGADGPAARAAADASDLAFEDILPAYRRLKVEQGGFSAVKIFDLVKALDRPKEAVHRLLLDEAKAGRVALHHTSSVELAPEVIEAGIRLPGHDEPFITVVVKNEP